jgi:hypothetical protein
MGTGSFNLNWENINDSNVRIYFTAASFITAAVMQILVSQDNTNTNTIFTTTCLHMYMLDTLVRLILKTLFQCL